MSSRIEKMMERRYPLGALDVELRMIMYNQRSGFIAGARAVLEEARRIAAQPDGLLYGTLMLSDLEALFTDMEDHERR